MSGPSGSNNNNGGSKPPIRERDRIFSLHFKHSRPLMRSNAVYQPKTPDQHLDLPSMLVSNNQSPSSNPVPPPPPVEVRKPPPCAPPPSPSSISRTTTPSLRNVASLSINSSMQSNDFLTVNYNRRRHSDSYFPTKRYRRHRMRGRHNKFSFSPNPR